MLIITDQLTLIWACSGFPDMTSCCSEMWKWPRGHRRGSKAKWWTCRSGSGGCHKVGQGALGQRGNKLGLLTLRESPLPHPWAQVTWQLCSSGPPSNHRHPTLSLVHTLTESPVTEETVCLISTLEMQMGGVTILRRKFQIHLWRHFNPLLFGLWNAFSFQSACQPTFWCYIVQLPFAPSSALWTTCGQITKP